MTTNADLRQRFLSFHPKLEPAGIDGCEGFYVLGFDGTRRAKWRSVVLEKRGECFAEVIALGLCDEHGVLQFDVDNADDIAKLHALDSGVQQQVATRIYEISGLADKTKEEAKKNSETTTS